MEAMQNTLSEMMQLFNTRMSEFEADLQKNPASSVSTSGIGAEFALFRTFILEALNSLQHQVQTIAQSVDNMEMLSRRKILLLHGVTEAKQEDTAAVVANVVSSRIGLPEFKVADIKRCHRMGRSSNDLKPRPILVKLQDVTVRDNIWFSKTKLKASGITVSEFLTKSRHQLFMAAREKFGVSKCWTKAGVVFILGTDDTRHRVTSLSDFTKLAKQDTDASNPVIGAMKPTITADIPTTRPKRTAAAKKL